MWLQSTVQVFIDDHLIIGQSEIDEALLRQLERQLRVGLDWTQGLSSAYASLLLYRAIPENTLDVLDFCVGRLHRGPEDQDHYEADQLKEHLAQAGSAWTVEYVDGRYRLTRRVDATTATAAKDLISSSGRAGQHLAIAWARLYGRDPDPSAAYREAIRAVEAIAGPVITPSNPNATLGTMISAIGDKPGKWEVVLEPRGGGGVGMVQQAMKLIWTSELDRHGTADESVPLHVSTEQADAALHQAMALVRLFQTRAIKMISGEPT